MCHSWWHTTQSYNKKSKMFIKNNNYSMSLHPAFRPSDSSDVCAPLHNPTNLLLRSKIWQKRLGQSDGFLGGCGGVGNRGDGEIPKRWEWGRIRGVSASHCLFAQVQNSSPLNIKNDLRDFLKLVVSTTSLTSLGSRFHNFGPTCEKARHPYLL